MLPVFRQELANPVFRYFPEPSLGKIRGLVTVH
jgi:hypothetical protein